MPKRNWTIAELCSTKAGKAFMDAGGLQQINGDQVGEFRTKGHESHQDAQRQAFSALMVDDSIVAVLPYAPSANRYWRSIVIKGRIRVIVSAEARKYKKRVAAILSAVRFEPFRGPIGIELLIYRPIRRGDTTNRIKVLEDVLQGIAYINDDQIEHIIARRFDDKDNPRIEIKVWNLVSRGNQ